MFNNINNLEYVLKDLSKKYINATFYMYERLEHSRSYVMVLDFAVGEVFRDIEVPINHVNLMKNSIIQVIEKSVRKLLAQKETVRLCTKFWTGVDIL